MAKMIRRGAATAVALLLQLADPEALVAQTRSAAPDPNAARLLVTVFTSNDGSAGAQTADAIRTRVSTAANARQLYVIPKKDIASFLTTSGFPADSPLSPSDTRELAKQMRADEVVSGLARRTAAGLHVEPRLMLARDLSLAQPLPAIDASNPADVARQVERTLQDARKQLADNRACENAIRDRQNEKAVAAANAAIAKYPSATIARLCLATAYQEMKLPPDSVLRVTDEIRRIDPKNSQALRLAIAAYKAKDDQEKAVDALVALFELEPTNPQLREQVIADLAKLGKPDVAVPIINRMLAQNPGDPQLLRSKWQLLLAWAASTDSASRQARFAEAVTTGEEMVRSDTTLADSVYFERQIIAANQIVPPRGAEFAARAVQKYPNSANFWAARANAERKAGQTQMAIESMKRALAIDPKTPNGNLLLAQIYIEMNQGDSAVAVARRAIAAGEDPKTWGAFLLGPTQAAFKQAQETKNTADFQRALSLAQEADRLGSSEYTAFFIGAAAFFIGADAYQQSGTAYNQAQKAKGRAKTDLLVTACAGARTAAEMFLLTQINMPKGAPVDKNTATTLLGYVAQFSPPTEQIQKAACK
jgi:tetratricopeptide (TPR) repeat protein